MSRASDVDDEFARFVQARQQRIVSAAYLITRDLHAAQDLTQEALVRAYRRWSKVGMPAQPEAYVRTIVVREYLTGRRRRSSTEVVMATDALPERGYENSTPEQRLIMREALADLPERQRVVLVLRAYLDLSDEDIADHLDCATGTVRSLAARAYARLRTHPGLSDLMGRAQQKGTS
ncbi:MAG: SigE family RNA polymerase sigma factor [Actinomycetia bacterium]|nr:SigE family RNA polymerase sigma factor [Actinomycetes bacterium]